MRCHTIYRLLMSGQILKLHPPEFETVPHTVYYQNQETVDLKDYRDIGVGPHTATQWQIWTGPQGTGTLLFDTQQSSSDLQDIDINFPYTYPMTVYMRARQWSRSKESDWSDDLMLYMEYCVPYAPSSGYSAYSVTFERWGDSSAFMNQHGVWVYKDGQKDNTLAGSIMSLYGTLNLSGSGNYTIQYACDDDCQVLAYNNQTGTPTKIVDWGEGAGVGIGTPGYHGAGWASGIYKNFSLPNGTYTFVFNLYNDTTGGNVWQDNPGGSGFIITDSQNGQVLTDSKDWQNNGFTTGLFCNGGSLGTDKMCHCVKNTLDNPWVSSNTNPIITDTNMNLLGSDYSNNHFTPHATSTWTLTSQPNKSGDSYINSNPVADTAVTGITSPTTQVPHTSGRTVYATVSYTGQNGLTASSTEIAIPVEYCVPYSPQTGYTVYRVTHPNWGDSNNFINQHGVWVMKNGTSNNVLAGDIMSLYGTVTLNGSGNYTIQYACDDDCQVLAYNSSNTLNTTILEWGDSFSSGRGTPQIHAVGWQSGVTKSFSLANDTYTFVFNIYNDPAPGPTWQDNPGGSAFILTDNANGNVIFDSKDWPSNGFATSVFCDGGSLGTDKMCHCIVNSITTPTLTITNDPIVTDQSFNLLGSSYANSHYSPHSGTIWNCDFTREDENHNLTQGGPIYSGSGTLISDTASNSTSPGITIARNDAINSQGSYPRLFAISSVLYQAQNGVRSGQSAPVLTSIEYCTPATATQGSSAYKVDASQSSSAASAWNQRMKDHAIWIYFQGTNQTLMGQTISIQVSMSFPAGTYYVEANADDTGYITFDGKTIVSGLGFTDANAGTATFTVSNTSIGTDVHSIILNALNVYQADNTTWNGNPAGIAAVFYSVDGSGNKTLFTSTDTWPGQTGITINSYYCPGSLELNPDSKTCHCYKSTDTANL